MKVVFLLFACMAAAVAVNAQDSAQAQLMGRYKFPDGSVVAEAIVVFENGNLALNSSAGSSVLEKIKGDSFSVVSYNGTAVFKRNEAKKVIGVHIDASGYILDGVKDSASASKYFIDNKPVYEPPAVVQTSIAKIYLAANVLLAKERFFLETKKNAISKL